MVLKSSHVSGFSMRPLPQVGSRQGCPGRSHVQPGSIVQVLEQNHVSKRHPTHLRDCCVERPPKPLRGLIYWLPN